MPKRVPFRYEPMIVLDTTSSVPLYRQLYDRLRLAILTGQLATGTRLPATRTLADQLGVSRNTVYIAYQRLLAEGYIDSKVGHGTSVARVTPETLLTLPSQVRPPVQDDTSRSRVSQRGMHIYGRPFRASLAKVRSASRGNPDTVLTPCQVLPEASAQKGVSEGQVFTQKPAQV